jgi:hypothetical protein
MVGDSNCVTGLPVVVLLLFRAQQPTINIKQVMGCACSTPSSSAGIDTAYPLGGSYGATSDLDWSATSAARAAAKNRPLDANDVSSAEVVRAAAAFPDVQRRINAEVAAAQAMGLFAVGVAPQPYQPRKMRIVPRGKRASLSSHGASCWNAAAVGTNDGAQGPPAARCVFGLPASAGGVRAAIAKSLAQASV